MPNRRQEIGANLPYQILLNSQVKQVYLEDLLELKDLSPNLALLKLIVVSEIEAVDLAQSILKTADTPAEKRQRLDLIEAILVNKFPQLSTEEILKMLNLRTADIKDTRFYQEVRLVGLEEGRQEGRQEATANLVIRLLIKRCGSLPSALELRVRSLLVHQLEQLGEALLDFKEIQDLENWLAAML